MGGSSVCRDEDAAPSPEYVPRGEPRRGLKSHNYSRTHDCASLLPRARDGNLEVNYLTRKLVREGIDSALPPRVRGLCPLLELLSAPWHVNLGPQ